MDDMESPLFWLKRETAVLPLPFAAHSAGLTAVNGAWLVFQRTKIMPHITKKNKHKCWNGRGVYRESTKARTGEERAVLTMIDTHARDRWTILLLCASIDTADGLFRAVRDSTLLHLVAPLNILCVHCPCAGYLAILHFALFNFFNTCHTKPQVEPCHERMQSNTATQLLRVLPHARSIPLAMVYTLTAPGDQSQTPRNPVANKICPSLSHHESIRNRERSQREASNTEHHGVNAGEAANRGWEGAGVDQRRGLFR